MNGPPGLQESVMSHLAGVFFGVRPHLALSLGALQQSVREVTARRVVCFLSQGLWSYSRSRFPSWKRGAWATLVVGSSQRGISPARLSPRLMPLKLEGRWPCLGVPPPLCLGPPSIPIQGLMESLPPVAELSACSRQWPT